MSEHKSKDNGAYEFNFDSISKSKMRSFRANNKLSKLLDNTDIVDGLCSHGTEYDNLKEKMRAKYLIPSATEDTTHVSSTVDQLQESLAKAKSLLKSLENKESSYLKTLREKANNPPVERESSESSEDVVEEKEETPEVVEVELDDDMIDEVMEEAENEEAERRESVSSEHIEDESNISEKTTNSHKYQLTFVTDPEEEVVEANETTMDQSEQQSIFGQVSSIFGTENSFGKSTNQYEESYEEKMKSLQASISKKLEKEAKENEISNKTTQSFKLTEAEKALDEKFKEQDDLISSIQEKVAEKENILKGLKDEYAQCLNDLSSKDSSISKHRKSLAELQEKIKTLSKALDPKLAKGKSVLNKLETAHNKVNTYLESSDEILDSVNECKKNFFDKDIKNLNELSEEASSFYDTVIENLVKHDSSHYTSTESDALAKFVESLKEQKEIIKNKIHDLVDNNKNTEEPHSQDEESENSTDIKDDESEDVSIDGVEKTDEESEDEDAISQFYKENNIKEGELLKTVVSQAISSPMEVPETETLSTRQNSVRFYNRFTDNIKNKISSTISSVKNIPNNFSLKRKRESITESVSDNELDESDIEKIENTFMKRSKQTDGKYRVVKMYVKDINKDDLIKHPALINPEDEDEEIEYITLVRDKLVTNPTDEVIVISSDEE